MQKTKTPCIGICSTTSLGDLVCRGCKRYGFEVINWNGYDAEAKQAVLSRIEKFTVQILSARFQIFSETAEFVYATKEEFWSTLWSHGMRETLERIEQAAGSDGLEMFKSDVFKKINSIKEADGLHQFFSVHIGLATKY